MNTNRLATLVDSYQLATKQAPPTGLILIHNQPRDASPTGLSRLVGETGKALQAARMRMAPRSWRALPRPAGRPGRPAVNRYEVDAGAITFGAAPNAGILQAA